MYFTDNNFILLSAVKSIKVVFNDTLIVRSDILSFNAIEIIIQRVLDDGNYKAVEISVYGGKTNIPFCTGYVTFKPTEQERNKVGCYIAYEECKANVFACYAVNHLLYCADEVEMSDKFKKFEFNYEFKEEK